MLKGLMISLLVGTSALAGTTEHCKVQSIDAGGGDSRIARITFKACDKSGQPVVDLDLASGDSDARVSDLRRALGKKTLNDVLIAAMVNDLPVTIVYDEYATGSGKHLMSVLIEAKRRRTGEDGF